MEMDPGRRLQRLHRDEWRGRQICVIVNFKLRRLS